MGPRGRFYPYLNHCDYIGLLGTGFMQVFLLGRAPRIKETLPDFLKWHRVTRYQLVFRGLTGSQRSPVNGASQRVERSGPHVQLKLKWDKKGKREENITFSPHFRQVQTMGMS